jgi:hypothetical protein
MTSERKKYRRSNIPPEEFVRIWQTASTIKEVAVRTGVAYNAACRRASNYRRHGVPLKKHLVMHKGPQNNWEALAKLAQEVL